MGGVLLLGSSTLLSLHLSRHRKCLSSFHTFTQALHQFVNFEFVGNFDQVPVSFNGELLQMLVLTAEEQSEGWMTFSSTSAEDSKRFFTYLPLIVVRTDGKPVTAQPLPI